MDEDDFESLLDAAFGIDSSTQEGMQAEPKAAAAAEQKQHTEQQQTGYLSPAASPVHTYPNWAPAGSPCLSDASMQMHASPPHDRGSSGEQQQYDPQLLYSPVRQGSPCPGDEGASPVLNDSSGWQQQQQQQKKQDAHGAQPAMRVPAASTQQPRRVRAGATAAATARHQTVSLCTLPREVQMRVLCVLPADSLTTLALTCSQFSGLCSEQVLWRRLFVHRWGKNVRHSNTQSWKVRYMERDAADLQAAGAGAQHRDAMQDIFLQAHRAKRHKALGIGAADDLMLVEDDEVAARVLAWRKSRGFATLPGAGGDAQQQQQRPSDLTLPKGCEQHTAAAGPHAFTAAAAAASPTAAGSCARPRVVRRPAAASPSRANAGSTQAVPEAGAAVGGGGGGTKQQQGMMSPAAAAASQADSTAGSQHAPPEPAPAAAQHGTHPAAGAGAGQQGAAAASGGASGSSSSSKALARRRGRQPRRWTQIGNVFCDEQTGWVHVCDESCSEKVVEPSSGLLVCPISGTCSARLLTCAEEAAEEGDRDPETEHREEEFGGERGRLARAFAAGYYCSDERELMRECGVYLPR